MKVRSSPFVAEDKEKKFIRFIREDSTNMLGATVYINKNNNNNNKNEASEK